MTSQCFVLFNIMITYIKFMCYSMDMTTNRSYCLFNSLVVTVVVHSHLPSPTQRQIPTP